MLCLWEATIPYVCGRPLYPMSVGGHYTLCLWEATICYVCGRPLYPMSVGGHYTLCLWEATIPYVWEATIPYVCGRPLYPMSVGGHYTLCLWEATIVLFLSSLSTALSWMEGPGGRGVNRVVTPALHAWAVIVYKHKVNTYRIRVHFEVDVLG